jgi:hypothetical protein
MHALAFPFFQDFLPVPVLLWSRLCRADERWVPLDPEGNPDRSSRPIPAHELGDDEYDCVFTAIDAGLKSFGLRLDSQSLLRLLSDINLEHGARQQRNRCAPLPRPGGGDATSE